MKNISSLKILLLALMGLAPMGASAAASGDHTAAHVKAYADELEGEKVSLDVVFIRVHPFASDDVPYVFFWAMTVDDDAHSGGGAIMVVADKSDKDSLIRRYGTNLDRDRGEGGPEHKSLRGTVRIVEREGKTRRVYMDITDSGVDLSNAPDDLLDDEGNELNVELPTNSRGGARGGEAGTRGIGRPPR